MTDRVGSKGQALEHEAERGARTSGVQGLETALMRLVATPSVAIPELCEAKLEVA
jgi:hypothetical protein